MERKRYYRPPAQRQGRQRRWLRPTLLVLAGIVVFFILCNAAMWVAYRGKVLPNVQAAQLPDEIALTYQQTKAMFNTQKAGITIDEQATKERLKTQRSWLPLIDVLRGATMPAVLDVQKQKFVETLREVQPAFQKAPLPPRLVFESDKFVFAEPVPGYAMDEVAFMEGIKHAIASGRSAFIVPVAAVNSQNGGAGLQEDLPGLNKQLRTKITFSINGQAKQPSVAEIGAWFEPGAHPSGLTMRLSQEKVKAYVLAQASSASNAGDAAAAVSYALDKTTDTTFVVATNAGVKYTYCASSKSVGEGHLPNFMAKVAAVLGDPRGWNGGGKVSFERVESGCDFTIWLSAPSQMTSFGGLCDNYYSCRSGRNVVINFDRWQGATDPWNASGGSLEDYRVMVTNHEVGHWLGFGHSNCPSPGQPAPVMQQQSISLQGCTFNPWPTTTEVNTLKANKGVAGLTSREEYVALSGCTCGRHDA